MGIICKERKKVDLGLTGNYSSRLSFFGGGEGGGVAFYTNQDNKSHNFLCLAFLFSSI